MVDTAAYKVPGKWKLLWKLVVLPKFRSFMWRVVRDCVVCSYPSAFTR